MTGGTPCSIKRVQRHMAGQGLHSIIYISILFINHPIFRIKMAHFFKCAIAVLTIWLKSALNSNLGHSKSTAASCAAWPRYPYTTPVIGLISCCFTAEWSIICPAYNAEIPMPLLRHGQVLLLWYPPQYSSTLGYPFQQSRQGLQTAP